MLNNGSIVVTTIKHDTDDTDISSYFVCMHIYKYLIHYIVLNCISSHYINIIILLYYHCMILSCVVWYYIILYHYIIWYDYYTSYDVIYLLSCVCVVCIYHYWILRRWDIYARVFSPIHHEILYLTQNTYMQTHTYIHAYIQTCILLPNTYIRTHTHHTSNNNNT